ncbi:MAG: cytochrome c oxidase subunit IV [Flammeovirgaceae bacterium]|jgi:cytochrome c oxidase subunit 4
MAHDINLSADEKHKAKMKTIVKVTIILSAVTGIEFFLAFIMGAGTARTSLFFILTIVKAYYIVSEFMHLGHEAKSLQWSIIFPLAFVVWLIVALLVEGDTVYDIRSFFGLL